jgi:hypothetical protein
VALLTGLINPIIGNLAVRVGLLPDEAPVLQPTAKVSDWCSGGVFCFPKLALCR